MVEESVGFVQRVDPSALEAPAPSDTIASKTILRSVVNEATTLREMSEPRAKR
jgi:hypothetical protein